MKIYKFRPLANEKDLCRIRQILETGHFWCSQFFDLNDPMEGIFRSFKKHVDDILSQKCKFKICSFSGKVEVDGEKDEKEAFENPILWGYYANGFRGVAIEIEVEEGAVGKGELKKIIYKNEIEEPINGDDDQVKKILCSKFKNWEHEAEYRFLVESGDESLFKIGKITSILLGQPFNHAANSNAVYNESGNLKKYQELIDGLSQVAKEKKIDCSFVKINTDTRKVEKLSNL